RTQAAEQLRLLQTGPSREKKEQGRAQLVQAQAALRATEVALRNLVIVSPIDGLVTVRHREPGEIVPAGSPVLTLIDPRDRWVRIYVKEDRVGAVRLGSRAAITSDAFPGKAYPGEVAFIASEAEFTPKNVQTKEERVKLVYAVKVRVVGDPGFELKPGLPADVRVEAAPPAGYKGAVPDRGDLRSEASPPVPLSLTGEGGRCRIDEERRVRCAHLQRQFWCAQRTLQARSLAGVPPRPSGRGGQGVRLRRANRLIQQDPSEDRG
ncbi:MAG TPA: HlyD family efflux transporter periplasmic adaptor subunit, partial [Thermoanaerobaculia bacterium]